MPTVVVFYSGPSPGARYLFYFLGESVSHIRRCDIHDKITNSDYVKLNESNVIESEIVMFKDASMHISYSGAFVCCNTLPPDNSRKYVKNEIVFKFHERPPVSAIFVFSEINLSTTERRRFLNRSMVVNKPV